jgi:hypothetical protein
MAVPFADVVVPGVLMSGRLEEADRVLGCLDQVYDETCECPTSSLKGQVSDSEVRGGQLLAIELTANLIPPGARQRLAKLGLLIKR